MAPAKPGDRVKIHYKGYLHEGSMFASSPESSPLEILVGGNRLPVGLENTIVGMNPGDSKKVTLAPEEGYGVHSKVLVITVDRANFPSHIDATVGKRLQISAENAKTIDVIITHMSEDAITLDANHKLAGKTLDFEIHLVDIL